MKRQIVFIVNPISGGKSKDAVIALIKRHLDIEKYDYSIVYTKGPGDATSIARDCEADIVVAVGGDGTVSEVASGLKGSNKALGIIPCGSGDGLALHLGISRKHIKAVKALNNPRYEQMDCATMEEKSFFCTCGAGFDALVGWNFAKSKSRGLMTYITESAKAWFSYKPDHYIIKTDEGTWEGDAMMVTVGNASQWGNNARITPLASVLDGKLDISIVEPFSLLHLPALAIRLMTGKAYGSSKTVHMRATQIEIERSCEGPVHLDGDPALMGKKLHLGIEVAALRIAVPSGNKKI